MPARLMLAPLECSDGTSPRYAISWRGLAKRERSPNSAINVAALTSAMPRIVCSAAKPAARNGAPGATGTPRAAGVPGARHAPHRDGRALRGDDYGGRLTTTTMAG